MSKIYFILFFLFFIFPSKLFSQVTISGQIKDKKNKPIEFLEVQLQNNDSIIAKSELTNVDGKFTILTEKGEYQLIIKQLGKVLQKQKITAKQDTYIGVIQIIETQQQLEEVIIASKKKLIERKVDRLIFNVENSISAGGGDAIDALKITPSIRVQSEKIAMIGKSGMGVMVDDKLIQLSGDDLINFLKTIPSDNIKNIEVITTPPAKYEAKGNGGLINIKLKKAKKDSWSANMRGTYTQTTYPAGSVGGGFNYDKKKISISSDLGITNGSVSPRYNTTFFYPSQNWQEENTNRNYYDIVRGRLGVNYKFSDKFNIGIQYMGSNNRKKNKENDFSIITNNTNNAIDSLIISKAENKIKNNFNTLDIYSVYKLDTIGRKISTNFNYLKFTDNQNRIFNSNNLLPNNIFIPNSYYSANNISEQNITNYSAKIDVDFPTKFIELTFGGKISFTKNNTDLALYNLTTGNQVFDPSQSNKFVYKENTEALYISGSKKLGKKWESQLGLRLETTQTEGNSVTLNQTNSNNYSKLFPTFYLSYAPNENNSLSFSYGKRLDRPQFEYLNPFRIYNNKYQYSEGNPFLQPSYSNNLEINYTYKSNWNSRLYYSVISNGTGGIIFINPSDNIQANIILNYLNSENIGLSESYTISHKGWFQSYNSFDVFYSNSKSTVSYINSNITGVNYNLTTNNNFIFNKKKTILFALNYSYNFKGVSGVDKISAYSQLDASLKFLFLNKNLSLTLLGSDILKSSIITQTTTTNNYQIKYKNYEDIRMFRISLNYKFGNSLVKYNKVDVGNEEEKNRLKK
ncbi:outer membrane beta-barrel family protein [Flavobacterium psychrophilum]|uniref:outer membrane beta-barrel family protein n=3 Tax=Flavobacterium psychrophilum TaxID=96345 RepID=UPI000B7C185C|nr:outer membrane beta-barrel family protein [Flavobacterium psychrophilum]SNA68963.1 putative TonB-dependent outer membrane receptor [Flavobacterium psychrophilum]